MMPQQIPAATTQKGAICSIFTRITFLKKIGLAKDKRLRSSLGFIIAQLLWMMI